jgi:hypothetical protein
MDENEYMATARRVNARLFDAEKVQIAPRSLESLMRHAFQAGEKNARDQDKGLQMFEQLFGKKHQ